MRKGNQLLLVFLFFLTGLGSFFIFRLLQVRRFKKTVFVPQESSFELQPPAEALKGELVLAAGQVKRQARGGEEFEEVIAGEELLEGERLAVGLDSQAEVVFSAFVQIQLKASSEISLTNLLPSCFLINQAGGRVNYQTLQKDNSLSIRVLHTLLYLTGGEVEVQVDKGEVIIELLAGRAKLALVDLANETQVWFLEKGQTALIDDRQRRVEIR